MVNKTLLKNVCVFEVLAKDDAGGVYPPGTLLDYFSQVICQQTTKHALLSAQPPITIRLRYKHLHRQMRASKSMCPVCLIFPKWILHGSPLQEIHIAPPKGYIRPCLRQIGARGRWTDFGQKHNFVYFVFRHMAVGRLSSFAKGSPGLCGHGPL